MVDRVLGRGSRASANGNDAIGGCTRLHQGRAVDLCVVFEASSWILTRLKDDVKD